MRSSVRRPASMALLAAMDDLLACEAVRAAAAPPEVAAALARVEEAEHRVVEVLRGAELRELLRGLPGLEDCVDLAAVRASRDLIRVLPGLEQLGLLFGLVEHFYTLMTLGYTKQNTDTMQTFVDNLDGQTPSENAIVRRESAGWRRWLDWRYARLKRECLANYELVAQCLPRLMVCPEFHVDDTLGRSDRVYGSTAPRRWRSRAASWTPCSPPSTSGSRSGSTPGR